MEIKVFELVEVHILALRSWADELFESLAMKDDQNFELDFTEIEFMSRAFAHQYQCNKKTFPKRIVEKNLNESVQQMLKLTSVNLIKKTRCVNRPPINIL